MITNYFEKMDTLRKFYWYGLLFADGYNRYTDKIHNFGLELQERDKDIIQKFHKELNFDTIIQTTTKHRKNKIYKYSRIQKVNEEFSKHLNNIGINNKKTKEPKLINMTDEEFQHFLRGFSDGDGCVYISLPKDSNGKRVASWNIVLHNTLIQHIQERILRLININTCIQPHWRTSYVSTLSINGIHNVYIFLNWLYENNNELYLERKYQKYLTIKDYYKNYVLMRYHKTHSSKYRGVYFIKKNNNYTAAIKINNKTKHLGCYLSEKDAALAYNQAAITYRGNKALLNIIN